MLGWYVHRLIVATLGRLLAHVLILDGDTWLKALGLRKTVIGSCAAGHMAKGGQNAPKLFCCAAAASPAEGGVLKPELGLESIQQASYRCLLLRVFFFLPFFLFESL